MPLSWVEIDLAALRHNLLQVRKRMSARTQIIGVVKSDAYGHGMLPIARELVSGGVHFLAVSKFWEAQELLVAGIRHPILVLSGIEPCDMEEAIRQQVRPALFRLDHAELMSRTACRLDTEAKIHLKVDTGMGRLGVPYERAPAFLDKLLALPGIKLEGILSHFAAADESDKSYSELQLSRFREVLGELAGRGHAVQFIHIANSAGLLDLPHAHFQLIRPGIMLYGSPPSQELHFPARLKPVMSLKAKILQLKDVPAGQPIGYGRTFLPEKPSRIATIPVGYDDGYPRLLSNQGQVLVCGQRAAVVGRVSMNLITIDVTHVRQAKEDDEVVLLGEQMDDRISAEEIAQTCATISYEIYCSIGRHRFKYFLNGAADL
ncbi:alanine racemase [Desulfoferrobacter suflitae]|uniref:alanine racemase n=1 Tax=Desulfoferrobacter suflitae TaxID=2865782 RepID=UPI002164D4C5|nr:alanine racemase [Desulfoferrobacter suflitae]MCK8602139.1 alanine racemase [Desulfoferrobacter suflitae]